MELFGRELTLEQVVGFVRCNAVPAEDLIHVAALELADALKAAIADIKHGYNCEVCKYSKYDGGCDESDFDCETCKTTCPCATCRDESKWQWRGPVGGKGEAK